MEVVVNSMKTKKFRRRIAMFAAVSCLAVCPLRLFAQSPVVTQLEEVEKLKAAEYQDYTSAMSFEDGNQKLGNYYLHKGAGVHHLIDEIKAGQQVGPAEIDKALDTSDAENYDNRPPVPLDDEIGNGY
jgi:hypothetical protein